MRDIFGIAMAVLIGLITLAFQAWTPQWWAGIIVSASLAIMTAAHILWRNIPQSIKMGTRGKIKPAIGIAILCATFAGGFIASHWPTTFLQPSKESPAAPEFQEPLMSRLNRLIMSCDVPPPPERTPAEEFAEFNLYKQQLNIIGDAVGVSFTVQMILGGIRINVEATTEDAKQRSLPLSALGVTKFVYEIRRLGKILLVTIIVPLPPQLAFFRLLVPNPTSRDGIRIVRVTEHFLGYQPGTCHLI